MGRRQLSARCFDGLAVRNEPQGVRRCIESVLDHDFTDLELMISDNPSDDESVDTLEEYVREDRPAWVVANPEHRLAREPEPRAPVVAQKTLSLDQP
jgi:glycosyltransferase involved in cell wall biosynthesis